MTQNHCFYEHNMCDDHQTDRRNDNSTLCIRAKSLLLNNCILLRKFSTLNTASTTTTTTTAPLKASSRQVTRILSNSNSDNNRSSTRTNVNTLKCKTSDSKQQQKCDTFNTEEKSTNLKCCQSSDHLNVIENQPTREAPYYYGDIIRSRKLDASSIFQQTYSNHSSKSQLISVLNSDRTSRDFLSVKSFTLDEGSINHSKRNLKVSSHIMDGIRVQLKNAGTRIKGASITTGTPQRLKHHQVSRSQESHVSLRGWLYRLEGGALKQWKRRWCVLADYCLFYYKDMAEQKLLGSALLPSFKINPCLSGDGISRKYAFKIEHSNMKTYYFAADTKEIQQQWMSALSMASIMQLNIFQTQKKPLIQNSTDKDSTESTIRSTQNGNEIDKFKIKIETNNHEQTCFGYLNGNNIDAGRNNGKLLYAPDGYPLSNMIDDQSRDVFQQKIHSSHNNNNNNQIETPIKYTDEVNGLPSLCHPQAASSRLHHTQQIANRFQTTPTLPYHTQNAFQSSYQCIPSFAYSALEDNRFDVYGVQPPPPPQPQLQPQQQQQQSSLGHVVYGPSGIIPPPKPRRAPSQQYFTPQGGLIFENYNGYEYSPHLYQLDSHAQTHQQFVQPMFYPEVATISKPYHHSFISNSYLKPQISTININSNLDRPRRPHSADFLERSEDDLECEVAFQSSPSKMPLNDREKQNEDSTYESRKQQATIPPRIMPTRPKSSFARYNEQEIGLELYDFPINLPTSNRLNGYDFAEQSNVSIQKHNFTSDDENRLNEFAEHQQNHLKEQIFSVAPKQNDQRLEENKIAIESLFSQPFNDSAQIQSTYVPETENSLYSSYQTHYSSSKSHLETESTQILAGPVHCLPLNNSNSRHASLSLSNTVNYPSPIVTNHSRQNSSQIDDPLIEAHRDELYKASQLFYRRTSSIISDSAVGASTQSSLYNAQSTNGDWSESGLPTTPATASQDSLIDSSSRSGEERETLLLKFDKNLNNTASNSNNTSKNCHTNENNGFVSKNNNKTFCFQKKNDNANEQTKAGSEILKQNLLPVVETKVSKDNFLLSTENRLLDQGVYDLQDSEEPEVSEEIFRSSIISSKTDSSIRFKLGQKVRTYRKPRPSSSSSTASSSLPNDVIAQSLSKNDPQAPYYITDLLSEQQRRDLQKKLPSNPLPPLLSRSTLDSARQSGITTLSLKTHVKNQDNVDSSASNSQHSYTFSDSVPLPTKSSNKPENKSLDDYFGTFDSSESDSSVENSQVFGSDYGARRKRRTKRRSKVSQLNLKTEKTDNASDSELHFRLRQRNRKNSNQRMYASVGDFIGKSREELSLMLEKYRQQQSKLSTSCDALKIAMESEAKMAELDPFKATEYHSRIAEFQRQLEQTQECVARKQPIIDRIDSLIRVSENPECIKTDKNPNRKDNSLDKGDNIENLKRQQNILAVELDRVRGLLTHSTRALEAKAVENAKMEAEMQAARKKLKQVLENDKAEAELSRSAKLERELAHINQVIDNLHSRRQELNSAIENLKYPSNENGNYSEENDISVKTDIKIPIKTNDVTKIDESESTSITESTSCSEESMDAVCLLTENTEHAQILEQKYRAFLAANTPLIPLYENLATNATVIPSFIPSQQQSYFLSNKSQIDLNHVQKCDDKNNEPQVEDDDDDDDDEDDENDEFFTLNLPKDVQLLPTMQSQLQNCEFNPQAYHQINSIPSNDDASSVMDEQIQQFYAYQQQQEQQQNFYLQQQHQQLSQSQFLSPKAEIRTVREVKREAERRKHHQAQSAKINALIRSLPGSGSIDQNSSFSQMSSHHFYIQQEQQFNTNTEFIKQNVSNTSESPITAPDLIQSTIH